MSNNKSYLEDLKIEHAKFYSYPEQFFTVIIVDLSLKQNLDIEKIYQKEWYVIVKGSDAAPEFTKDHKINYQSLLVEKHLDFYILNPDNNKKDFLNHFQYMLRDHSSDIKEKIRLLLNGWLNYHLDLLNHPEKEIFLTEHKNTIDNLPDHRTRAYFIHFHIQLGSIPMDKKHEDIKLIEKPKFMDYVGDIQAYNLYIEVRTNEDSNRNKTRCCNYILSITDNSEPMFFLIKSYLSQLDI